ncbi:hypothetical protein QTH87_24730 [Variovorax sp. J22P168]|uniref:hypothetical protein n=1 Tax=Variovorax jilinensis TaxID=3053513 RepID=UPI002578B589|nr:hypothetical protein [Variovorax sp. J22P168]MDM0015667.1 hypothetical protein [Variovorax sp. J22P168]
MPSARRFPFRLATATLAGALLAGCASDPTNVPMGVSREQVLQQVGSPTAVYRTPTGDRLQYSRGPLGFAVTNVDLDTAGRVRSVRQELDEGLFGSTIRPGVWRVPDVLFTYGQPYQQTQVTSFNGTVWSWRYLHINNRRFLYIYVDPTGRVDHYNVGDDLESERWRW